MPLARFHESMPYPDPLNVIYAITQIIHATITARRKLACSLNIKYPVAIAKDSAAPRFTANIGQPFSDEPFGVLQVVVGYFNGFYTEGSYRIW